MFTLKHVLSEGEPGAAGGSSGSPSLADLQKKVQDLSGKLDLSTAEIDRLRNHSQKLLDEKKGLKATLDKFGDIDPEQFTGMMKTFESSEEARLIAEGKLDEVLAKRTERMRLDSENKLVELQKNLDTEKEVSNAYKDKYNNAIIHQQLRVAAEKAGVLPSAIDDVLARANGVFSITDDGKLEAYDKDGTLKTFENKPLDAPLFVESLKKAAPHYWPASQSGGAQGGAGGSATIQNPFVKGSKHYNVTEQAKLRRTDPQLADKLYKEAQAMGKG